MNETLETIWKRRSVRKYKSDPIPQNDLNLILEAARRAPTGANRQKWLMVVATEPEVRKELAKACNNQVWMMDAPVILCLVTLPGEGSVNGAIVLDHAILAATSLGYGTCWVGAYNEAEVKKVLGIPEDHGIICLTPIGISAEQPDERPRKSPSELFMKNKFGDKLDYSI